MVQILIDSFEDNSSSLDVNYEAFNIQHLRGDLVSSLENFWHCVKVKTDDYVLKNGVRNINIQRANFLTFLDGSVQQSHEIRKYISKLKLIINCPVEDFFSVDDYIKELDSLLEDTKKNIISAEVLKADVEAIKNKLIEIGNDLKKYKEDVQNDPENMRSRSMDELNETTANMESSTTMRNFGLLMGGIGAAALAVVTSGFSIAVTVIGAATAVVNEVERQNYSSQSDDIRTKLEQERRELTINIDNIVTYLGSIITTIGELNGYWELQSTTISDLLDKMNAAKDEKKFNKMLIRVIGKTIKDLELDEIYSKDYCITMKSLIAKYEM